MPAASSRATRRIPSLPGKRRLVVLGTRDTSRLPPLTIACGSASRILISNLSRSVRIRSTAPSKFVARAPSATSSPAAPATFCVPDLKPRSCPPPARSAAIFVSAPLPRARTPVPCGPWCQWQPKTAHFWQLKTAHFGEGCRGRIRHSPVDVPRAFRAGRRERSDRRPARNAARSGRASGHPATPSRRFSVAVWSHS